MRFYYLRRVVIAAMLIFLNSPLAVGQIRITEFMSEGQGLTGQGTGANRMREFFELTNLGATAVDSTGWSYNDNNVNDPLLLGSHFGIVAPGESIIFTQMTIDDFRSYWALAPSVRIFSFGNLSNLGNADTINIYNSAIQDGTTLVDSLSYTADARGSGLSRNRPYDGATGQYSNTAWLDAVVGDTFQSRLAPNPVFPPGPEYIDLANPGVYVPEPSAWIMALLAGGMATFLNRRRAFSMGRLRP